MILKSFAVLFALLVIACVFVAQAGDNTDSRAMATIFYIPAIAFGVIDLILWIFVVL